MDDKIDKVREALDRLKGFTHHAADNQDAEDIKTVCSALSAIDPEAIRREWISVNDRLPRDEGQYLVLCRNGYFIAVWNPEAFCWDDADGDDYWKDPIGYFTHWMNLPDMPPLSAILSAEPAQDDGKEEAKE